SYSVGNFEEAIDFYRKAIENSSSKQAVFFQFRIAECFQEAFRLDEAIQEYLKVSYFYPQNKSLCAKALLRIAQIYEDREDIQSAKSIYQKILQMDVQEAKYAKERLDLLGLQ
ncbi:MAG: soluble NSF attachment family protein, partial [Candidatus Omnitrophica bacterium]|nr:soluble NSF attachment family protein [Candidatus Omnitrophota bacterium]